MHPLQNRHEEHTFARYCSKSSDYSHRNSVAQLFSCAGFSSPQQARAPDSCVPYSARLGLPGPARPGACLRLGAGSGSARRRKFPGLWGRRTHSESLVSGRLRRRQRRAGLEVSDRRPGMRGSSIPKGGGGEAVSLRPVRGGKPSGGAGGGALRAGTAPQVLSGAAEVRAAWEEELPGKGGAGVGARPEDEHWKFPELGSAGTSAAEAGTWSSRAPTQRPAGQPAAGSCRASPGTYFAVWVHPRPAGTSLGCRERD